MHPQHHAPSPHVLEFTRRHFLSHLATGAVASVALGQSALRSRAAVAEDSPWALRLSTSSIMFRSLSIEETCREIAALGFQAVDIWSAHEGCPHLDDVAKRLGGDGLRKVLTAHRLKLCGFSVYAGGYPRYAQLLGDAGGGVAIRGSEGPCPPAELTRRMRAFLEGLKPEVELAARHRTQLAIENHGDALLHTPDSLKAFVDLNTSPQLGIALAPYHLQAGGFSVPDAIRTCGRQLAYFYAWQRAPDLGQLPGHGPTDFTPWIAALRDIRYGGYVNPFMHGEPGHAAMVEALKKSVEDLARIARELGGK